jgi:hypothetical protein
MDLSHLIHCEGVERLRAIAADGVAARDIHLGRANLYRARIDLHRRAARDVVALRPRHLPTH